MDQQTLEDLYSDPPPWDLGRPQREFRLLAEAGAIGGKVLDIGCGTGELTLMAAALGLDATGVELSLSALRIATGKARGLSARFLSHDARRLADLDETFDTALDSLVFHVFDDPERDAYVTGLRGVLRPGGRYFMLGLRDPHPGGRKTPRSITPAEIRAAFADGWRVDAIDPATIESTRHPDGLRGWLTALTRVER